MPRVPAISMDVIPMAMLECICLQANRLRSTRPSCEIVHGAVLVPARASLELSSTRPMAITPVTRPRRMEPGSTNPPRWEISESVNRLVHKTLIVCLLYGLWSVWPFMYTTQHMKITL